MANSLYNKGYEEIRENLICRLISESEREYLSRVPHKKAFGDLYLVPCLYQMKDDQTACGFSVTREIMSDWNIDTEQLIADAFENMQKVMPCKLDRMGSLMESDRGGSVKETLRKLLLEKFPDKQPDVLDRLAVALTKQFDRKVQDHSFLRPMWVLGNTCWLFGAVSVLYPGVLEQFAQQMDSGIYILPSSIHEVILLPEGGNESRDFLYGMVASANSRMTDCSKKLSDRVYYYDRHKKEIQTF
ncbi:MAG: hypothetical protein IJ390_11835 [Lachnospiraceae bacterium]|nr:hypothetical protein [Lachnospiraceae bacterium]